MTDSLTDDFVSAKGDGYTVEGEKCRVNAVLLHNTGLGVQLLLNTCADSGLVIARNTASQGWSYFSFIKTNSHNFTSIGIVVYSNAAGLEGLYNGHRTMANRPMTLSHSVFLCTSFR
jgi:hypothetical protein